MERTFKTNGELMKFALDTLIESSTDKVEKSLLEAMRLDDEFMFAFVRTASILMQLFPSLFLGLVAINQQEHDLERMPTGRTDN